MFCGGLAVTLAAMKMPPSNSTELSGLASVTAIKA
jgi:hypothetical protein